jgi:hypothetical protein
MHRLQHHWQIMSLQLSPFDSFRRLFKAEDLISRRRVILLLSSIFEAFKQSKGTSFKKLLVSLLAPCFNRTSTHPFFPFMQAIFVQKLWRKKQLHYLSYDMHTVITVKECDTQQVNMSYVQGSPSCDIVFRIQKLLQFSFLYITQQCFNDLVVTT